MASNISITNLPQVNTLGDNDVIPVVAMGKTSKITYPALVSQIQSDTNVTWETLTGKVFEDIDTAYFKVVNKTDEGKSISTLTMSDYYDTKIDKTNKFLGYNEAMFTENSITDALLNIAGQVGLPINGSTGKVGYSSSSSYVRKANDDIATVMQMSGGFQSTNDYQDLINKNSYGLTANGTAYGSINYANKTYSLPYQKYNVDIIGEWQSEKLYKVGYFAVYNSKLYMCKTANNDVTFTESKWQLISGGGGGGGDVSELEARVTALENTIGQLNDILETVLNGGVLDEESTE